MFKRILSLMLCIALVFAMGTISFAVEENADTSVVDAPEVDAPEADAPEADAPEADVPEADTPEADAPEADVPEADTPEADAPEADAPEADAPEADAPEADAPEADAPEVDAPEVDAPEVDAPIMEVGVKYTVVDAPEYSVFVNGVAITFEDVGIKKITIPTGDVTFVPVRKIAEMLNCTVAWSASDRTVHIFKNGKSVVLTIDNHIVKIYDFKYDSGITYTPAAEEEKPIYKDENGVIYENVTPVIEEGRTLIPLRAIAECLNTTVDSKNAVITIDDNDPNMLSYKPTMADRKAKNLIETYNYKPAVVAKSGSVTVNVSGNFEGATSEIGNGVTITINGQSQTTANGGTCTFAEVKSGTYKVEVTNIPEGYALQDAETTVTVEGGAVTVNIYLVKAVVA